MAVEIDVSANYSIGKTFNSAYQYALFSYNQNLLQVSFEDWGDSINEDGLIGRLKSILTSSILEIPMLSTRTGGCSRR